jgi:hypothetical protein
MVRLDNDLERWERAGLIDPETTARIRAFEEQAGIAGSAALKPHESTRPGAVEALLYLGVAVLVVGAVALTGQQWSELRSWSRVAVLAVPALLSVLVGLALKGSGAPSLERAGSVVWMVSVALIAGTVAVANHEYELGGKAGIDGEQTPTLLLALFTLLVAAAFWVVFPRHPQVLALGGSAAFLAQAAGMWPDDYSSLLTGICLALLAVAGLIGTELGGFVPRYSARVVSAGLLAAGAYVGGLDAPTWTQLLVLVVGAGLLYLSVTRDSMAFMVIGVAAIFVGLITFIFRHFASEIGAPLALMLSGAIVIGGVLLMTQLRPLVRADRAP